MRVINVVVIKGGVVDNIDSFGVFEEQLVQDVVKPAEELFIQKAKDNGFIVSDENDVEELLDMGYFEFYDGSVCISWSDI
jgi:hypothetical protein